MEKKRKEPYYSLTELKIYWNRYDTLSGLRFLVGGKWQYDYSGKTQGLINATKAEKIRLRDHMSFPKFLEEYGKNKH